MEHIGDLMKISNILFIAVVMIASIGLLTYPANAETGSIIIDDTSVKDYNLGNHGTAQINWSKMKFDVANYNYLSSFHVHFHIGVSFVHVYESTTFTIVSGGSGSGYVYYDANSSIVYYVFDTNTIITSSPVTVNYNKNIFANITTSTGWADDVISVDNPLIIWDNVEAGVSLDYHSVTVSSRGTDYYTVDYPIANYFRLSVVKNPYIATKYYIDGAASRYSEETTFNKVNIVDAMFIYTDGIYLNATLASGAFTNVLVNSTGISGYIPPGEELIPGPVTGVGIQFNAATYSQNDIANISWIRTVETPLLCTDYVRLQTPQNKYDLVISPSNSGYIKEFMSIIGTYMVSFERECLFFGTETLDSDSATVGSSEQTSYLYAPAQVGIGQSFNVTYLIGWTKTSGSTVWLRDYSWDNTTNSYSATYQPWALSGSIGVETNQSILVTKEGKHLLKLCDVLLGCKASTIINAYFNGSEISTNISLSNITIDKISYSYGETILVKTAVDNFNWSNKQIVVEYEDYDQGIIQNQQYIQEQIESFPLYISDLTFSGSGASRLRLTGKNSTGDYILAYVNFTLSNVDSEGYGLSVTGETNCVKDTIQINVIVPAGEVGNLTVSSDDAKYNKAYSVNGTKTISYKYQIDGTYYITLSVNGEAKRVIIKLITSTGNCAVPVPTTTYKNINGSWNPTQDNIKETCSYWDNWVRGIFGIQGVNDMTRLLLALGAIVAMMFIGLVASKGNFGVAIILGFFPYAFFTYMTLSSPCGQYMPLWINIFIALIIGIKMKWFS